MMKLLEFLYGAGYIACIAIAVYVTLVIIESAIGVR